MMKSVVVALGCSLMSGCSGEATLDDEAVGFQEQAFNAAQCSTAKAVKTSASRFSFVSPGDYGTACNATDVTSMHSANSGNAVVVDPAWPGWPNNATDCEQLFVRAVLYDWSGSGWVYNSEVLNYGRFIWDSSISSHSCVVAPANFGRLTPGLKYRIAATARPFWGSPVIGLPFTVSTWLLQ